MFVEKPLAHTLADNIHLQKVIKDSESSARSGSTVASTAVRRG